MFLGKRGGKTDQSWEGGIDVVLRALSKKVEGATAPPVPLPPPTMGFVGPLLPNDTNGFTVAISTNFLGLAVVVVVDIAGLDPVFPGRGSIFVFSVKMINGFVVVIGTEVFVTVTTVKGFILFALVKTTNGIFVVVAFKWCPFCPAAWKSGPSSGKSGRVKAETSQDGKRKLKLLLLGGLGDSNFGEVLLMLTGLGCCVGLECLVLVFVAGRGIFFVDFVVL